MKNSTLAIFCFVLVLVQLSVLDVFFGPARTPNLILATVVYLAMFGGFERYLGWIVLCGFLLDLGSSRLLGSNPLLLILAAFSVDRLNAISDIKSRPSRFFPSFALIMAVSLFIFGWASYGLANLEKNIGGGDGRIVPPSLDLDYLWKNIFTILGGFAIYFFARKFEKNDLPKISK